MHHDRRGAARPRLRRPAHARDGSVCAPHRDPGEERDAGDVRVSLCTITSRVMV